MIRGSVAGRSAVLRARRRCCCWRAGRAGSRRSPRRLAATARSPRPVREGPSGSVRTSRQAGEQEVVGRYQVPGVRLGQIADLAVHKGYAYLNSWDDPNCEGGGTYVVDIRDPGNPKQVSFIPAPEPYYHGEGAHVVSLDVPGFKGDILAVNDETYGSNLVLERGLRAGGQDRRRLRPLRRQRPGQTRSRSSRAPATPTRTTTLDRPRRATSRTPTTPCSCGRTARGRTWWRPTTSS